MGPTFMLLLLVEIEFFVVISRMYVRSNVGLRSYVGLQIDGWSSYEPRPFENGLEAESDGIRCC